MKAGGRELFEMAIFGAEKLTVSCDINILTQFCKKSVRVSDTPE